MPVSGAAGFSQLLLNAVPDDGSALLDVLAGLQEQGLTVAETTDAQSALETIQHWSAQGTDAGVLTVWSRHSILDERVVAVAEAALERHCLIPIRIEEVEPPIGFRQAQTYDIVNLTQDSGRRLGQELRLDRSADTQTRLPAPQRLRQLLLRAIEWLLYVVPAILIYAALFGALLHGTSDYITFIAAAFIIVDTALIGVPAYLGTSGQARALQKLTHGSRIDLVMQFILALVLALFATAQVFNPANAWIMLLFLSMICAAAAALLTRYIVIGLWLAYRATPWRWPGIAALWLVFLLTPALLYAGVGALLLHGLVQNLLFFYLATTNLAVVVFDVPGFAPITAERAAALRVGAARLTALDLAIQSILSVIGGLVLHIASGAPTFSSIGRFGACAAVATMGRYIGVRVWVRCARASA